MRNPGVPIALAYEKFAGKYFRCITYVRICNASPALPYTRNVARGVRQGIEAAIGPLTFFT